MVTNVTALLDAGHRRQGGPDYALAGRRATFARGVGSGYVPLHGGGQPHGHEPHLLPLDAIGRLDGGTVWCLKAMISQFPILEHDSGIGSRISFWEVTWILPRQKSF